MKFMISGGGTGGHIFPAVAIAEEIRKRYPSADILFVGAEGRMEMEKVPQAGFNIVGLPVRGLYRKHLWRNAKVLYKFYQSYRLAKKYIQEFCPNVVIGVGGFASAPTLKAAQRLGIPTLIQEQNSYAGISNKMLSGGAKKICVAYPDMQRFFPPSKIVFTGNPIRPEIEALADKLVDKKQALSTFAFEDEEQTTLLVMGGSLGARTINETIANGLEKLEREGVRLIWQTGKAYYPIAKELIEQRPQMKAFVAPFIQNMQDAYSVSDLLVSRAGALSISEIAIVGKVAVLVPSPNVAEDHQTKNALALSSKGAARMVADKDAQEKLLQEVFSLMKNPNECERIKKALKAFSCRGASAKIVDEIDEILAL